MFVLPTPRYEKVIIEVDTPGLIMKIRYTQQRPQCISNHLYRKTDKIVKIF